MPLIDHVFMSPCVEASVLSLCI